jgi:hypothetical protein
MSSRRILLLSSSLSWLVACGPVVGEPGDESFEALCGEEGPVELLTLAADEEVVWFDRIDEGEHLHVRVKVDGYVLSDQPAIQRRNVVLDACGAEVAEVASGADGLRWWNDVLLGCIEGDLVSLSSYDDPEPTVLARGGCGGQREDERWVTIDAEDDAAVGRIVVIEMEGSSLSVRELVPAALNVDSIVDVSMNDGQVFAQTPDLAVYRVDPSVAEPSLADGGIELVLEQADAGEWSVNGDLIAYRAPASETEDPSPLILRDRRTGAEEMLGPNVPIWAFSWLDDGLLTTYSSDGFEDQRWWRLDPLRELDVPEGTTIKLQRDDGLMWLERREPEQGVFELLLWAEGEAPQLAWSCPSCTTTVESRSNGYVEMLVQTPDPDRRELWRFDAAGSPPLLLGNAMHSATMLDDGRLLTVVVGDDDEHGPLMLRDGEDDPGVTLVENVDRASITFTDNLEVPGEIVYEAALADGTHGLFRAQLAL